MNISFYIPEYHLPSKERQASWLDGRIPPLLEAGKSACAQCWIYQTWAELRHECDVRMVAEMPREGPVITLSNLLDADFRASEGQFVTAIAADYLPHPGAQVQILQNKAHALRLPGSFFIPLWPQPNLIPRDPSRGNRFETVAFLGDPSNLAPEVAEPVFAERLRRETGASLEIRGASRWHDFSDVDAVLAIRDFSPARHLHKPATKLYNAWIAGVPLIAGSDSAFQAEGAEGEDYLVARSADDCIRHLKRLADDASCRMKIVESGQKKAASRSRDAVRQEWMNFCSVVLPDRFHRWKRKSNMARKAFWFLQGNVFFWDRKLRS